jgi:uncharacterized protein (TIGR02757 family)
MVIFTLIMNDIEHLRLFLDEKVSIYNNPAFIGRDPISIPHLFTGLQDREISGFFAATLAWGNRTSIISSCHRVLDLMNGAPYEFVLQHSDADLKKITHFAHRTFNTTDLLYFIEFFRHHYSKHSSLEDAFVATENYQSADTEDALLYFRSYFFSLIFPERTKKHVSTPAQNSACKRLNMFLRWMVRKDCQGVDFGLWDRINARQLICPLDVHVARTAAKLGIVPDEKATWKNAVLLTEQLRLLDPTDPVKYDFALFSLGAEEKF